MLVVRDPGHEGVPRDHDEDELDAVADQLRAAPGEALLQVHLFQREFVVNFKPFYDKHLFHERDKKRRNT